MTVSSTTMRLDETGRVRFKSVEIIVECDIKEEKDSIRSLESITWDLNEYEEIRAPQRKMQTRRSRKKRKGIQFYNRR